MAKQKTISKEIPLSEITLRRYEKPSKLSDRELVRKLCLSVGLLQPGDSRDVIVDILYVLLKAKKQKKLLSSEEIEKEVIDTRKKQKLALHGIASSNIRRQLKRLRDLFLVEKVKNQYTQAPRSQIHHPLYVIQFFQHIQEIRFSLLQIFPIPQP